MLLFKEPLYAPVLAKLHALCFQNPWSLDNFQTILQLPTTFGYLDKNGFILCSDLGDDLEILTLAVHPNFRRQGIAFQLISTLQNYAIQHQKQHLFLEVNIHNLPAISLYQKCGFIQSGQRKNYYHEDDIISDALCFTWKNPR